MLRPLLAIALLAALAVPSGAQTPGAPAALMQAIAATEAAKLAYAFDVELRTSERRWRARYEPDATPKLRLLAPAPETLEPDERRAFERFAENMDGLSWCANEFMGRIADARLVSQDESFVRYSFQPTPESVRSEQSRRFAHRMRGELTMTRENADVARIRIYTPQAFSPMPLVRLEHMNIVIECAPAPNGRRYAAETVSEVHASAFGRDFNERSVQRASNLTAR